MINAQEWLEKNYPDQKTWTIYLNQPLEGILDCSEYKNLKYIFISSSIDSSKLEIKKGFYKGWGDEEIKETNIIPCLPAQTWLDQNYPKNGTCQIKKEKYWHVDNFGKTREEITKLDIGYKSLEGNLDLSDFKNLEELSCYNNCLTNLNVNNCLKLKEIWCYNNQLTTLNVSNLKELETLECSNNYLTQIPYFPQPEKITWLNISNNHLSPSNLTIFSQFRNLKWLYIGNWNKNQINQNIYNHFTGSLEPLKDLNKLERLDISNTDLNSGWEYLPDSLKYFWYDTKLRPNCKLALVKEQWDQELWKDIHQNFAPKYKKDWLAAGFNKEQTKKILEEWNPLGVGPWNGAFINWFLNFKKLDLNWALENEEEFRDLRYGYSSFGTCEECQQPNTSQWWCHSCNAKHFQEEFNTWTSGNFQIDDFIQKCQLEATSSWNLLEWIPYEKFSNIKPIAKGGFGKVEKAEWEEGYIAWWDNEKREWERSYYGKTIALKTLFNSQNLNQNFLSELTLYKMFKSEVSQMVPCYGISRDTEGNYIMVMEYMQAGNLREYLRENYWELKFYNKYGGSKLRFLKQITQGLKDIHRKKLVHRDFHSGNIIVGGEYEYNNSCHITDLGLSKPVNEAERENTIYGLMPYMAPEVLKGEGYTQKSDIYSLGMVMYEVITGLPPYAKQAHDTNLALMIIQGIRPQFPKPVKYPQILVDLIKRCWDSEPNNRPSAREISGIVGEWFDEYGYLKENTNFYHQVQACEAFNKTLPDEIKYPTYHSQEVWHSKPIQITHLLESHNLTLPISLQNSSNNSPLSTRQFKRQLSLSAESSSSKTVRYQEPTESMETDESGQLQTKVEVPPKSRD